ncbi:MAG: glycosyltransferase [Candidatus Thiodiazotropha taylori]|uniref:Glycosyltransferase n=1 Tax=Candidatus Thiodiazotropha taylori TaxID=2792791 RepID=A0A9E4KBM2_9GAMM|nr:glycosyltransferase [Candidatus Thiodiazotropha taylori]MCG7968790.1 glycosyltransferase [Candidatus Thiodiazotropha taylori]MCG8026470.1 glycosyltransferase [Candidatus Thiodiazotropha taylori]MCG8106691.1 glycosyltransferase [Candidatus Thiodiazotropha taylori]MCG8110811.1 glycosyltransferase [Candidatus Thiodiazotropha taylori]
MESTSEANNPDIALSFIIPTMNEADNIGRLIDSIQRHNEQGRYEIIVVDNGSEDQTRSIAETKGATVLLEPELNVSALRNTGVAASRGTIYIFLDGDIELTEAWAEEFPKTRKLLEENNNILTGSKCSIANPDNYLERYWFADSAGHSSNYVNSGHLIIHKQLFSKLQGFDPELVTGEDTDLSVRAKTEHNASIVNNPKLKVLHHGYPNDLFTFVKREAWHGTRTSRFIDVICCSNIQLATNVFLILHLVLILALVFQAYQITQLSALLIVLLLFSSALYKYGANMLLVTVNSGIFYFYYLGRSISILKCLFRLC